MQRLEKIGSESEGEERDMSQVSQYQKGTNL